MHSHAMKKKKNIPELEISLKKRQTNLLPSLWNIMFAVQHIGNISLSGILLDELIHFHLTENLLRQAI